MQVSTLKEALGHIGTVEREGAGNTRSLALTIQGRQVKVAYAYSKRHPEDAPNRYAYWWTISYSSDHYAKADWVFILCEHLDGVFLLRGFDLARPIQKRPKAERGWDLALYTDGEALFRFYGPGVVPTDGGSRFVPSSQIKDLLILLAADDKIWREFVGAPPLFVIKEKNPKRERSGKRGRVALLETATEPQEKRLTGWLSSRKDLSQAADNFVEVGGRRLSAERYIVGSGDSSSSLNAISSDPLPEKCDFSFSRIERVIANGGLLYNSRDLYSYHLKLTCLSDKHFVILSGISGTGKTELARAYANAVYHQDLFEKSSQYFLAVQVEADWQNMRPLLGFFNHLTRHYERKPFLDMLIRADAHVRRAGRDGIAPPFFVCLDEMNIARVEYYFSQILAAMESGNPIHIHNGEADGDDVPRALCYPRNLYITATINTDESTFSISDKVLDRAYVVDLSRVDTAGYQALLKSLPEYEGRESLVDQLFSYLRPVQESLAGTRFCMGYRTLKEMVAFVAKSQDGSEILSLEDALDDVLAAKGLAKIRGDGSLIGTLERLEAALGRLGENSTCLRRVLAMKTEIGNYGLSQFAR